MVNCRRITVNGDAKVFKLDKSDCRFPPASGCHSRERGNPIKGVVLRTNDWIPAYAGMTQFALVFSV
ncbi:MAG: hypothetical protein HY960_09475 [Ignavibacteriae bacterium]|nr:hypothetical protein [Ignavibacteriota bacterium]